MEFATIPRGRSLRSAVHEWAAYARDDGDDAVKVAPDVWVVPMRSGSTQIFAREPSPQEIRELTGGTPSTTPTATRTAPATPTARRVERLFGGRR